MFDEIPESPQRIRFGKGFVTSYLVFLSPLFQVFLEAESVVVAEPASVVVAWVAEPVPKSNFFIL